MDYQAVANSAVHNHFAMHDETELAETLKVVDSIKPKVILEIGSAKGGSLFAFSQIESVERLIALSINPVMNLHGAEFVRGDSTKDSTQERVKELLDGTQVDFVFIDGDHREPAVRSDFEFALDLKPKLIGVHDLNVHLRWAPSKVYVVWQEIKKHYKTTEIENVVSDDPGMGFVWL